MNRKLYAMKFRLGEHKGSLDFSKIPSMTDQSYKNSCDINVILAMYRKAGQPLPGSTDPELYGDFSKLPSFQNAQNLIIRAQEQFDGLDARVRRRFDNDPAQFLKFVNDPKNDSEMYDLGLKVKPPAPAISSNSEPSGASGGVPKKPSKDAPPSSVGQTD